MTSHPSFDVMPHDTICHCNQFCREEWGLDLDGSGLIQEDLCQAQESGWYQMVIPMFMWISSSTFFFLKEDRKPPEADAPLLSLEK